jgi:hypothetical protein
MHARLDQLLSLRDGAPVDAAIRDHVQQCETCIAKSARLMKMRLNLQSLPTLEAQEEFWRQIEARLQQRPQRRYGFGIAAALALVVAGAIAFVGSRDVSSTPESVARTASKSLAASTSEVEQLIAQSRKLEELLAYLPERPQVERVSTAATVDSLEQRIQWLDWRLAYQSDGELDERQAQRLWSERVDLMDSLVKVRYAQSAPMLF